MQFFAVVKWYHKFCLILLTIENYDIIHSKINPLRTTIFAIIKKCCHKLYFCAVLISYNSIRRFHSDMLYFLFIHQFCISPPISLAFYCSRNRVYKQLFRYSINNPHLPDTKALLGPGYAARVVHRWLVGCYRLHRTLWNN